MLAVATPNRRERIASAWSESYGHPRSPKARDLHPTDESQSVGTQDWGTLSPVRKKITEIGVTRQGKQSMAVLKSAL